MSFDLKKQEQGINLPDDRAISVNKLENEEKKEEIKPALNENGKVYSAECLINGVTVKIEAYIHHFYTWRKQLSTLEGPDEIDNGLRISFSTPDGSAKQLGEKHPFWDESSGDNLRDLLRVTTVNEPLVISILETMANLDSIEQVHIDSTTITHEYETTIRISAEDALFMRNRMGVNIVRYQQEGEEEKEEVEDVGEIEKFYQNMTFKKFLLTSISSLPHIRPSTIKKFSDAGITTNFGLICCV